MRAIFKKLEQLNTLNGLYIQGLGSSKDIKIKMVKYRIYKPNRCIKSEAEMLKNPAKAIKFYSDTHDCTFNL